MSKKADVWVPHELTEKNILDRVMICESLLKWNSLEAFLKRVVTGDEKWVVYNNIRRKRSWCGPEEVEVLWLEDFFAQKSRDFYKRGIMSLPERWQKVVDQDGQYILD
ncbi:Histone-lysine N-methyltransferase SETMAR [Ooceraea biroi]|uniref:Histone-lysine N-methyltransferase SETMAR n=1 Tax=Ooceraea biroi TaxID=2015173 RepID=A0A026W142_OOCBI|nr:Histone-lysine N-methyltransferase SETMAR [Ooceraea biroi]